MATNSNKLVVDVDGKLHNVTLAGEWLHTPVSIGDRVSVYLTKDQRFGTELVVDDDLNFLVTDPDTLLSATILSDSFACTRRAVLSALTQPSIEDNRPSTSLVIGSLVHSVIEAILLQRNMFLSDDHLHKKIEELVDAFVHTEGTRLALHACGTTLEEAKKESIEVLQKFPLWYNQFVRRQCQVVQVEENLWSVRLGIKGKVDATIYDHLNSQHRPLEIKSGNVSNSNNTNHRGQTLLYALLLSEHYPQSNVDCGELYYVQSGETIRVNARRTELRAIIQQRNRVAKHVKLADLEQLPDMITNEHLCQRCFQRDICLSAFKVQHGDTAEPPILKERHRELFSHQPKKLIDFIKSFLQAISAEEEESQRTKSTLWKDSEEERVRTGRSVHATVMSSTQITTLDTYKVVVRAIEPIGFSWLNFGDVVVVSMKQRFGISTGFILDVSPDNVLVLSLDRPLCNNQIYSIDKDGLTGSFGVYRANLLKMLTDDRVSRLVCDLDAPRFNPRHDDIPFNDSNLDEHQQEAIRHVLCATDYALIIGMPGTGKTSTLAFLIHYIVQVRQETVLLVSHTHAAIDNVLIRLKDDLEGFILRLGSAEKVHSKVVKYLFNPEGKDNDVYEYLSNKKIVAGTTLSLHHHPLFVKTRFDWCIVDEASQLHLPACLAPIRLAGKFLLVGDPQQLPPLVRSRSAKARPLLESLFHRLLNAHPLANKTLHKQYRMNKEIMKISNQLIYNHQLVCGNEFIAERKITICNKGYGELEKIIDAERPVLFVNMETTEERIGDSFQNRSEAMACNLIVEALIMAGLSPAHIAVICPFQPQLRLLKSTILHAVELATVDRFQGRDFPCVLISLVRSNPLQQVGELLSDWRRINVAFTRAQSKLIILGSRSTLSGCQVFADFFKLVDQNEWQADWSPRISVDLDEPISGDLYSRASNF